ncbi:MAG TPA: ribose-phosphate diphosphokinase [Phenylobacterium sp.]|nr:ribose-phosphate diphosphokinase [Phenylobacterium sp.]
MIEAVHAFGDEEGAARRLAEALNAPFHLIQTHVFPDGESLPTVAAGAGTVAIYRSLDRPDAKLMPLLLAADALRRRGVGRLILVAPYLAYLRQDMVFEPGQPLSRDVLGRLLGERFDAVVTVEPHLHRTSDLTPVFAGAPVVALSATAPLAAALAPAPPGALVVGPDGESQAWAQALAKLLSAEVFTFTKTRHGDRLVDLTLTDAAQVEGRPVVLVDDICSTGGTLVAALNALRSMGARSIDLAVAHALFDTDTEARLRAAGARRILSTDSCPHPTNAAPLATLLAQALRNL